jgi:F-type H+-transporting ATPase subunit gamma
MPTRRELDAKLSSARGLRDIIHSMRSLAAVNIRRAEEGLATVREYNELVVGLLRQMAPLLPQGFRWGQAKGPAAILVFSSDQGLCGQFNERVVEFALKEARRLGGEGAGGVRMMVLGARGAGLLRERGVEPALEDSSPRTVAGLEEVIRHLATTLFEAYAKAGLAALHLAYNRYESAGSYTPTLDQILPLPLDRLLEGGGPSAGQAPRLYTSPQEVAERLIEEYLFVELHRALGESLASENGARLRAMDEALHNIDRTLERLSVQLRISRQEEITAELLDVIGGVEALKDAGPKP